MNRFVAFAMLIAFAMTLGCGTDRTAQPATKPVKKPDWAKQPPTQPTQPAQPSQPSGVPEVGMEAPEITGLDLDGVEFNLSDYRGKVVLLDFWGDW